MTIFQYLNSILFSKKKIDLNCDDESQFNLFMINRWTSMYSKELNEYVNETTNKYWSLFDDKPSQFNYVYSVFPKLKFKKLNYIKKIKKEKKSKEENKLIPEFYSQREYKQLVELENLISK
jgi:Zn-dependent M32 family carboxypeptidase